MTPAYKWRRKWHPTPIRLPGKSHRWRSLVGCSPWGCEELDTTEQLHFHFSLSCIGEGNGNPLQCSCLENPRDGGAWWAAVYGVSQSRTRLKWLSRSSSSTLGKDKDNELQCISPKIFIYSFVPSSSVLGHPFILEILVLFTYGDCLRDCNNISSIIFWYHKA